MEFPAETVHSLVNTDIWRGQLWLEGLEDRDRALLAIASFITHYLDWQPRKKFLGPFFVMATSRSGDLQLKGIPGPCGVFRDQ
jgi:hypothetical protein